MLTFPIFDILVGGPVLSCLEMIGIANVFFCAPTAPLPLILSPPSSLSVFEVLQFAHRRLFPTLLPHLAPFVASLHSPSSIQTQDRYYAESNGAKAAEGKK